MDRLEAYPTFGAKKDRRPACRSPRDTTRLRYRLRQRQGPTPKLTGKPLVSNGRLEAYPTFSLFATCSGFSHFGSNLIWRDSNHRTPNISMVAFRARLPKGYLLVPCCRGR